MPFFVYGLYDPRESGDIRYVGAASHLGRPLAHEREASRSSASTYKLNWIRKVGRIGWRILEACDSWEETMAAERRIIQGLRASGERLTNLTDGGQGTFNPSPELRARYRSAATGAIRSPEHRAKIRNARIGTKRSLETCAKLARIGRERRHSEDTRIKMSLAHRGRPWSEARRAAEKQQ
jgi:hypothetical protein